MASPPDRFQVLALDGGGAKALFTTNVLAHLEEDLGIAVSERFDLITGTSAGGIIALALGIGLSPAEIVDHYRNLTSEVFPRSSRALHQWPRRLLRPTYNQEPLRESLLSVFGDRVLGDSRRRLVIPSWDAQNGCVHLFKTPHHERLARDWKIPMIEVGMATSAAPTYLPAAVVNGQRLVDGGVWANNPSVVGIAEAVSLLNVPLDQVRVLNIGTTTEVAEHPRRLDNAGLARWATRAVDLVVTAGSRGAQGLGTHLVGPTRFLRIDASVPAGLVTLDDADSAELAGRAADISRKQAPAVMAMFADHAPTSYEPLHPIRTKDYTA